MANDLAKAVEIAFEEVIEGFDAECVMSREVMTRYPDQVTMPKTMPLRW